MSTSCSSGIGNTYLYHLGPLGRRGETCRQHATAVTSQGASWLLGITLVSHLDLTDLAFQGRELVQCTTLLYVGSVGWRGNVILPSRNTEDTALVAVNEKGLLK